jgi:hypothetical protein
MMGKRTYREYERRDGQEVPRMLTTHHIYLCMSNLGKIFRSIKGKTELLIKRKFVEQT